MGLQTSHKRARNATYYCHLHEYLADNCIPLRSKAIVHLWKGYTCKLKLLCLCIFLTCSWSWHLFFEYGVQINVKDCEFKGLINSSKLLNNFELLGISSSHRYLGHQSMDWMRLLCTIHAAFLNVTAQHYCYCWCMCYKLYSICLIKKQP